MVCSYIISEGIYDLMIGSKSEGFWHVSIFWSMEINKSVKVETKSIDFEKRIKQVDH